MRVFLAWSGRQSGAITIALRDWLPRVIEWLDPCRPEDDLRNGARWSDKAAEIRDSCLFGLVCLTRENLDDPWLLFEAGALSHSMQRGRVAAFLVGLNATEVSGPLSQFPMMRFEKEGVERLLHAMNEISETSKLDYLRLSERFEQLWPQLENAIKDIAGEVSGPRTDEQGAGSARVLLDEIQDLAKAQSRALSSIEQRLQSAPFPPAEETDEETRLRMAIPRMTSVGEGRLTAVDGQGHGAILVRSEGPLDNQLVDALSEIGASFGFRVEFYWQPELDTSLDV
jgi:hypothetical protein